MKTWAAVIVLAILMVGGVRVEGSDGMDTKAPATQPARDASWATPIALEGVPNLHRINANLYRSAQPTAEGMKNLQKLGIRTIVSLRTFNSDEDELEGTSLKSFRFRVKTWHIEEEDAVGVLKIITDPANQPVLIHCQHGADRTGTMCALYRIAVEGWSKEQAIREMVDGGYGYHPIWSNLRPWIEAVNIDQLRQKAGIPQPKPANAATSPAK
jgi:protein tyrosine phosphatase (PTP) superfamily phosphohydrolase (DUF442 family)